MGRSLLHDSKRAFISYRFLVAVLLLLVAGLFGNSTIYKFIASGGNFEGNITFLVVLEEAIRSDLFMMAIPIAVTLPYAGAFIEEINSRFYLYSISRVGKRSYFFSKSFITFLSGGVCVLLADIILLPILMLRFPMSIEEKKILWENTNNFIVPFLKVVILSVLNGGIWAMIGSISTILMKSKYMTYTMPFICYYILSVFQERYYPTLYFLSPVVWGRGTRILPEICILVLIIAAVMIGVLNMYLMQRREECA